MKNEFSVYWYDPTGAYCCEAKFVGAEEAVELARSLTNRPAARMGIITRVMITDGGDFCVLDWRNGEGIVFPPPEGNP